jgi:[acyl-carrier-protein] S-malonyltransferase
MQAAVPVGAGAMAAFIGIEAAAAQEIAAEAEASGAGICQVANDNGGGQVVVSGAAAAVARAIEIAKARGVKRAIPLPVSAPFHCSMMQPAAEAMADALAGADIKPPVVPLVANVVAAPVSDPAEIRKLLVQQVTGTVRWRECISYMAGHGVTLFVECGAGKVLSGLVKRIADGATGLPVGAPADVDLYKTRSAD